LGMLLPLIGILAFLTYYRAGHVNLSAAFLLALGFAIGAFFGAKLVTRGIVPERTLRVLFGLLLIYVAANTILRTERRIWALATGMLAVTVTTIAYLALRA